MLIVFYAANGSTWGTIYLGESLDFGYLGDGGGEQLNLGLECFGGHHLRHQPQLQRLSEDTTSQPLVSLSLLLSPLLSV